MFARLMTPEDYNNFTAGLLAEDQIRERISQLQEFRRNGLTTFKEAEKYEQQKKARITAIARSPFAASSDRLSAKHLNRLSGAATLPTIPSTHALPSSSFSSITTTTTASATNNGASSNSNHTAATATGANTSGGGHNGNNRQRTQLPTTPLDLTGCEGVEVLTASEQALCSALRLFPRAYMSIKETLLRECEKKGGLKRREARDLVRIDVNKLGKVYDFFVSKGWVFT